MLVKDETVGFQSIPDEEQMRDICSQVKEYLETTNAFLRKDLSLSILSRETGIYQKLLSRSINEYLELLRAYQRDASGGSQAKVAPAGECWSYGR